MTTSRRFMNWTAVGFTPDGGTLIPISGVTSVAIESGGTLAKFSGDGDRYNSLIVNDFNEPSATVQTADIAAIRSLGAGTFGMFTATHNDAVNKSGTGATTYTMRAVVDKDSFSGKHRAFGEGTISFLGYSGDGQTNPLSSSVAL